MLLPGRTVHTIGQLQWSSEAAARCRETSHEAPTRDYTTTAGLWRWQPENRNKCYFKRNKKKAKKKKKKKKKRVRQTDRQTETDRQRQTERERTNGLLN